MEGHETREHDLPTAHQLHHRQGNTVTASAVCQTQHRRLRYKGWIIGKALATTFPFCTASQARVVNDAPSLTRFTT